MPATTRARAAPANTAAAPAGAAAAADTAPWQEPLRTFLKHAPLDESIVCGLLSSSNAAAAVAADCCSGALAINLNPEHDDHRMSNEARAALCSAQAAWLRRYGSLVRELQCSYMVSFWPSKSAFTELLPSLASSTKQLERLSGGFDLAAVSTAADVRKAAASLGALSSLTHLTLSIESAEQHGGPASLLSSLRKLSSLSSCELCISGSGPRFMRWGAVGLEHLPAHLTSLRLGVRLGLHSNDVEEFIGEAGVGELQCMLEEGGEGTGIDTPGNMFGTYPSKDQPPMSLGHLTALKELRPVPGGPFMCDLCIRAGDVLPPNLTALELDEDCRNLGGLLTGPLAAPTVRPLLSLTSLQELTIHYSKASAQDLKHLSSALAAPKGALTAVSLGYQTLAAAAATAGGWPSLPMVGLRLSTVDVQIYDAKPSDEQAASAILSAVSQLTGLTALSIGAQGHLAATPQQLAGALAGLTNLKEFKLESSTKADKPDGKHSAAGVEALSKQLAGLPNLVHLTVREVGGGRSPGLPVSAAIIDAGANRQQLTHLQIGR